MEIYVIFNRLEYDFEILKEEVIEKEIIIFLKPLIDKCLKSS